MAVALACLIVAAAANPAGALTKSQLKAKTLSLSDLPTGWSVNNSGGSASNLKGCFAKLQNTYTTKGITKVGVAYELGNSPVLDENLITGPNAAHRYAQFVHILSGCTQVSLTASGTTLSGSVGAMSFPTVGNASRAYSVTLSAEGINVGFDIVLFRIGQIDGDLGYLDLGSPDVTTVQEFATAAVDKVEGKPIPALPSP